MIKTSLQRREFLGSTGVGVVAMAFGTTLPELQLAAENEQVRELFRTNRQDGRFQDTAGFIHNLMKENRPKLAFNPDMSQEDFPAWQTAIRQKLREMMAFPEAPPQPVPKRLWIRQRDGYQVERWEAYPEPDSVVPFMIVIPEGVNQRSPAPTVMCFPGSSWSLESLVGESEVGAKAADNEKNKTDWKWQANRMALHLAERGMVAVAVANPATNDTSSNLLNRSEVSLNAILLGRCYLGISTFQKSHILEWISEQPFVDRNRIAVCGHSLGSEPSDVLGVLYPNLVKAVVHNDFCCNWIERSIAQNGELAPAWHLIPGMYQWFDATDWEASIAPRPLLFTEGGRANQLARIKAAYRLNGVEENMQVYHYAKYADPASRIHDFKPLPEGLDDEEYFAYANVDAPKHSFRHQKVVPWLARVFDM